jgi:Butirosin biosynthesis protein H, N-terminal/Domain of unknown function (DUF4872)
MTARKHLKQLVRDRMRRTGERYTVARRHVVAAAEDTSWEFRGGLDGETAAFANVLANLGVEPRLSEAMVLGVGGGLGAGYILWEFEARGYPVLTLGFRRLWQYPARWATETAERLELHADIHETGGAKGAAAALDAQLERGLPAIAWIDTCTLGHRFEPESRDGFGGPPLIVYAREGDRYAIDDRSLAKLIVPAERLAAARARVGSYEHRLITIDPELVDLDADRLRAAVEEGLRLQVEHLSAKSDSFSLPAWRKWARMTTDTRNKKGWPNVFADGRGIGTAMASIYVEAGGGRNLRGLYADFVDEAAKLLSRPALREAAAAWRGAAQAWDAIVDAALPPADELRELIDRTDDAVARGEDASEVAAARWALQARRDEAGEPPALGELVSAMYETEVAALARQQAGS